MADRTSSTVSVPRCELPGCSGLNPDGTCANGYGVTCESLELEPRKAHAERRGHSAAKAAGPGFPEGSTLEQTGPETWQLTMPGPTEEELRYAHEFPPQTLTYEPRGTT